MDNGNELGIKRPVATGCAPPKESRVPVERADWFEKLIRNALFIRGEICQPVPKVIVRVPTGVS